MKAWFGRHIASLCLLLCLLLLAGAWIGLRAQANAGTYELQTVEGDVTTLIGTTIDLRLEDAEHRQLIRIEDGALSHTYEPISPFRSRIKAMNGSQALVEHEDADVDLSVNQKQMRTVDTTELWETNMKRAVDLVRVSAMIYGMEIGPGRSGKDRVVQLVTNVTIRDESHPFLFYLGGGFEVRKNAVTPEGSPLPEVTSELTLMSRQQEVRNDDGIMNDYEMNLRTLYVEADDGTVYFTPALLPYHGGESAIYRVDEWGEYASMVVEPVEIDGYQSIPASNTRPVGKVTPVSTFPVEGKALRTISLDLVDDKLCLLLVVNGKLTLRVYDKNGALLAESGLFDYAPEYQIQPTLFVNKNGDSDMLCYMLYDQFPYDPDKATQPVAKDVLFCVEVGQSTNLRSVISGHPSAFRAAYIDDRWALVEWEPDEAFAQLKPDYAALRTYLSVLDDAGNTLYKGEIVTDSIEDRRQYFRTIYRDAPVLDPALTTCRLMQCDAIEEE